MPHRLMKDDPLHAAGPGPLMATLRYQCECKGGEVITISTVFSRIADEQTFVWTMQRLWRDMQTEIKQHTKPDASTQ